MADKRLLMASEVTYNTESNIIISMWENIGGDNLDFPWPFCNVNYYTNHSSLASPSDSFQIKGIAVAKNSYRLEQ